MINPITIAEEQSNGTIDFIQIHKDFFVDIDEVYQPQPVAISIGYNLYKGTNYPIPYGSYGDFSCIVGASKAKKSFFKSALISSYIGGNSSYYFGDIKGHNSENKYIIDIDTEQSKYHAQRTFRRVAEMVGSNTKFYKPFALRELSANERLDFIDWIFNESEYKGKIGLVSIDGVADLVNDVNDLVKSNEVAQKLLTWSGNEQCHIITVLHRNFQTKKPTGHLGSAVLKKAETVVFVEKEDDYTIVNAEYTRNQPFDSFAFYVNENWLPIQVDKPIIDKKINNKNKPTF
jgi:hypothetical protein